MTSGTIVEDLRTNGSWGCGPGKEGLYYSKTWNGNNRSGNPSTWFSEQHSYSMSMNRLKTFSGVFTRDDGTTFTGLVDNCFGGASVNNGWTSNDDLALLGKLREEVAGSGFNAATSLAEGKQSLDMIFESSNRIYHALRALRKGDLASSYETLTGRLVSGKTSKRWGKFEPIMDRKFPKFKESRLKNASSNWLQLQYGWLPLIKDTEEAAQFLAARTRPRLYKVRVRRQVVRPAKGATWFTMFEGQCTSKGQIVCYLREINVPALSGLTNPLSVAWELLPYSFVADWFIPIGSYLDARGLAQALSGTFVTTKFYRARSRFTGFAPGCGVRSFSGSYEHFLVQLERTVSGSLSIPLPSVKPLGEVMNWRRAANSVALLTQKVLR